MAEISSLPVTDDLLAEIFLLLPTAADLVRASAACVSFRRLVTDRSFLRRFRSLHAAPFLGFLNHYGFHPALPPHPSAPAARAVSLAADFSFSFLPSHDCWMVRDIRDGRVLVDRTPEYGASEQPPVFTELVVCDPLHRRYLQLPPIPDDLAASVEHRPLLVEPERWCEPFLAPPGEEEEAQETSFRVIWMAQCQTKPVAFVFSSSTGEWRAVASQRWDDLLAGTGVSTASSESRPVFFCRRYACGCFYWVMDRGDKFLMLDTQSMEFSIADLPTGCGRPPIAMVDAGEGSPGMFSVREHIPDGTFNLYYTIRRNHGQSSNQWQMEKIIPLDPGYRYLVRGATERYLLLLRYEYRSSLGTTDLECFSMDVETLQLQSVCSLKRHMLPAHIYTSFAPSLSSQTI